MTSRKQVVNYYKDALNCSSLTFLKIRENTEWHCSYFPVLLKNKEQLLEVQQSLNKKDIFPRRYFYPSLNAPNYVNFAELEVSQNVVEKILCLPLNEDLNPENIRIISRIVNEVIKG